MANWCKLQFSTKKSTSSLQNGNPPSPWSAQLSWRRRQSFPPGSHVASATVQTVPRGKSTSGTRRLCLLVGGLPTPLKNMKVSWDDDIPNIWKNKKCSISFFHSPESMDWREKMNRKPSIFPLRYIWGFPVVKTNPLTEQLGYFGMVPRTEHHRRRGTCIIQQVMVQGFGSWNRWLVSYKVNELNVYV